MGLFREATTLSYNQKNTVLVDLSGPYNLCVNSKVSAPGKAGFKDKSEVYFAIIQEKHTL